MKQFACYIRVSGSFQVEHGQGFEDQRKETTGYCKGKRYKYTVFEDPGISAKDIESRPAFIRMLKDIRAGKYAGVVVTSLSRLFRNTKEALDITQEWREKDIKLIILKESIDTTTSTGKLFFTFLAAFYEWEKDLIKERTTAGKSAAIQQGKWVWGESSRPYGFKWNGEKFVRVKDEVKVVKEIFKLILNGISLTKTAKRIKDADHPTKLGGVWRRSTIDNIIRNTIYSRPKVMRPGAEAITADYFISIKDQDRAIAKIDSRKFQQKRVPRSDRLLAGLVYCPCGSVMIIKRTRKWIYYVCSRRHSDKSVCNRPYLPAKDVDDKIWGNLKEQLPYVEWLNNWEPTDTNRKAKLEREKQGTDRKIAAIRAKIDRAGRRLVETESAALVDSIKREAKRLQDQLTELTGEQQSVTEELTELESVEEEMAGFDPDKLSANIFKKLEKRDIEDRRTFLEVLFGGRVYLIWGKQKKLYRPRAFPMHYGKAVKWLEDMGIIS
jgi:site-specific DNA recombinase